jgi:hypothetical protein
MIQSLVMAFGYRMRSGKDEAVAEIIRRRSGNGPGWFDIRGYSFAKSLKQEINTMAKEHGGMHELFLDMDLPEWVVYDPAAPMDDPYCPLGKQRGLLQYHGVFRREQDPEYWVKRVAAQIEAEAPEIALLGDLRFLNEFAWAHEYGDCIRVDRPGLPLGTHVSETELSQLPDSAWDGVLVNDSTLDDFKEASVNMFDALLQRLQ